MKLHLLIASAVLGLVAGSATLARSGNVTTLPAAMFTPVGSGQLDGSLPGGTWAATGVTTLYVDGQSTQGGTMLVELLRLSFSGTRTDVADQVSFSAGTFDLYASFPSMGTNPQEWDYYSVLLYNSTPNFYNMYIYGVGAEAK